MNLFMRKFKLLFYLLPLFSHAQEISPDMFLNPINTGSNMSLGFEDEQLNQFVGGQVAAFFDINGDGNLDCVGLSNVVSNFFIITIWGDDALSPQQDGLMDGEVPILAILTTDEKIILIDEIPSFLGFSTNELVIISQASISAGYCDNPFSCNFEIFNYTVDFPSSNCEGLIGCMDTDYLEFNPNASCNNLSCVTSVITGCMNVDANNFDILANSNVEESCLFSGCMNNLYIEFDSNATSDNGSCLIPIVAGCMNESYIEFDYNANVQDGSCQITWHTLYLSLEVSSDYSYDSLLLISDTLNQNILEFQSSLDLANATLITTQSELETAMSNQEDGIGQSDLDSAYIQGYEMGVISLEDQQTITEVDAFLLMPEGWSFFGFTCIDPLNLIEAFAPIVNQVLIVKDNNGNVYLPQYGFNGIGDLFYGLGYQLKLTEALEGFQFCPQILPSND